MADLRIAESLVGWLALLAKNADNLSLDKRASIARAIDTDIREIIAEEIERYDLMKFREKYEQD